MAKKLQTQTVPWAAVFIDVMIQAAMRTGGRFIYRAAHANTGQAKRLHKGKRDPMPGRLSKKRLEPTGKVVKPDRVWIDEAVNIVPSERARRATRRLASRRIPGRPAGGLYAR